MRSSHCRLLIQCATWRVDSTNCFGCDALTAGDTVGEALSAVFAREPQVRSYVLDDRGQLRKHVCVFADGKRLPNGGALGHPLRRETKVYVMQALSGG